MAELGVDVVLDGELEGRVDFAALQRRLGETPDATGEVVVYRLVSGAS